MNRPNAFRIDGSYQTVSTRPLAVAAKPRLTAAHIAAVDPGLLEKVKDIFSDSRAFSSRRQVCESSFTSSLTYNSRHDRLLDPASFREKLSDLPKHATYNAGPSGQSPTVDPAKPDTKLDGWLPAPSGLRRKGVAERVTGHSLPQTLNECADKATTDDFRLTNLYRAGTDVKGRESGWDPRVRDYSVADKPPWPMPYPVNDLQGRWSDGQRLARHDAEATSTSYEMRGLPVINRSASSSATKPPGHYSQVAEGEKTASLSAREQQPQHVELSFQGSGEKRALLNSMYCTEAHAWSPVGYDAVSRTISQGEAGVDTSSAAKWPTFRAGNAAPYPDSDVIIARRSFKDHQRIEFESYGQTLMVVKTAGSEDVGAPPSSHDSAKPNDDRHRADGFGNRSASHDRNRSEISSNSQPSNRDRDGNSMGFSTHGADPARKGHDRDMRGTDDAEVETSGSQSSLPVVYRDYNHRSARQDTNRKSSAERELLSGRSQATDSWAPKEYSTASAERSARKSEDRSRLKKSATDDFLRTKFLLEIERREKELRRIADSNGSLSIRGITAMLPNTISATSHFEDDREKYTKKQKPECDLPRMLELKAGEKRYDSDRTLKSLSTSVSSSRLSQEHHSRRDEVTTDRSRRLDDVSSAVFEDFRRPLPPTKTDYRIPELSVPEKPRNFSSENNSADVEKRRLESQSYGKNSNESAVRSSRSLTYFASSDGIRSLGSDRGKTNAEGEVSGGFQREERVAYWENLKAQLENEYSKNLSLKAQLEKEASKKQSPVESQRRSSDGKFDSQSKNNSSKVKEAGATPKDENSEQHGRFRAKTELTPKREYSDEKMKVHAKMERTPKKEEKGTARVKMEPAEERSFGQSKEAKKSSADIQARLTAMTKQSVRGVRSLKSIQKVGDQGKIEKQTTRIDQVHSLNISQKVTNKVEAERNAASKQKMAYRHQNVAAGKADPLELGHKVLLPKTEEKPTAGQKQPAKKAKIVNKNAAKPSHQPETKTNERNINFPPHPTSDRDKVTSKEDPKSGDLRNLLNALPGSKNWRKREITRQKDDTSVILIGDPISEDEDELVIEVPEVRRKQADENAVVSLESLSGRARKIETLDGERRNARKWRAADDELELPRKRFKFNQNERFERGGGVGFGRRGGRGRGKRAFDFNQRCVIDRRSTTQIRFEGEDRCADAVAFDDYRHGDEGDAGPGNRREEYGEEGYFETGDRNRISNPRDRYNRRSRDRSSYTREQYEEAQHRGDDEELFRCDADDRFPRNEEYYEDDVKIRRRGDYDARRSGSYSRERVSIRDEERFPTSRESYEEANEERDNEDYDGRFSGESARKRFRQRSSARCSNEDADERYRADRDTRYVSDDGNEQLRTRRYGREPDEQLFRGENDTDDVGEFQGTYTDRPARYTRKRGRGRTFESPVARTITFDRLKGPRSFLKDLEQNCVDGDNYPAKEVEEDEDPCEIEVTIEGDFYDDDDNNYVRDTVYEDVEGMVRDVRFEESRGGDRADEFDYRGVPHDETVSPISPDGPSSHTATRFGGPSRGGRSSFRSRAWRGRFFNKSARGNRFQHRFGPRGRFGFQPHDKRFLPPPKRYLRRLAADPEFAEQSEENIQFIHISKPSNSVQDAVKQVMSNLKEAEMADPEADAALFDTLSRGEKKQVIEIQQMTGIQCVTAIVTALRTLWEFEPKVVRTLGNLEPEEIQQLGDDG